MLVRKYLQRLGTASGPATARSQFSSSVSEVISNAMVFDIDGVLIRGSSGIPGAKKALERLCEASVPFALLTNSASSSPAQKAAAVSAALDGFPIDPKSVVTALCPLPSMLPDPDSPVLVIGRHGVVERTRVSSGLKHLVSLRDYITAHPEVSELPETSGTSETTENGVELASTRGIGAIIVAGDPCPTSWLAALQVTVDIARAPNGSLHDTIGPGKPLERSHRPLPVLTTAADLVWADRHPTPRFGGGAFIVAMQALIDAHSAPNCAHEGLLDVKTIGKPSQAAFKWVENLIRSGDGMGWDGKEVNPTHFTMVGDNPRVDIAGASTAGEHWSGLLVRTGVWDGTEQGLGSGPRPTDIVDNVEAAVSWTLAGGKV